MSPHVDELEDVMDAAPYGNCTLVGEGPSDELGPEPRQPSAGTQPAMWHPSMGIAGNPE